jgi:WD40 repeat protein
MDEVEHRILSFSFNSEGNCLVIGTTAGFGIYDCNGFQLKYRADIGGVGLCEMFGKSNIIALVGAGENPEFPQKKLIIYNTKSSSTACEFFYDNEKILNIKMNNLFVLAVATSKHLYIYSLQKFELIRRIDINNPNGFMDVCNSGEPYLAIANQIISSTTARIDYEVLIYPISELKAPLEKENSATPHFKVPAPKQVGVIRLSVPNEVGFIRLNKEGNLLAVAHTEGTIINIYKVPSKDLVVTYHRGMSAAKIYSLCFSADSAFLLCTSNRGTVHIFDIQSNTKSITTSILGFYKKLKGENTENKQTSIFSKDYERKCFFTGAYSSTSKLAYLFDEEGYFTELRQMDENKFLKEGSIKAEELLK